LVYDKKDPSLPDAFDVFLQCDVSGRGKSVPVGMIGGIQSLFKPIIASPVSASVTVPLTVIFCEKAVSENTIMTRISIALRPR